MSHLLTALSIILISSFAILRLSSRITRPPWIESALVVAFYYFTFISSEMKRARVDILPLVEASSSADM